MNYPQKITASSSRNAVSFLSACTTKRFPSSRCASAIQIVRPLESTPETQRRDPSAQLRNSADLLIECVAEAANSRILRCQRSASIMQASGR